MRSVALYSCSASHAARGYGHAPEAGFFRNHNATKHTENCNVKQCLMPVPSRDAAVWMRVTNQRGGEHNKGVRCHEVRITRAGRSQRVACSSRGYMYENIVRGMCSSATHIIVVVGHPTSRGPWCRKDTVRSSKAHDEMNDVVGVEGDSQTLCKNSHSGATSTYR